MYQEIDKTSYKIYYIPTNRFKRNTIRIEFCIPVEKEKISLSLFLFNLLFEGSEKYPTKRLIKLACDDLYALNWSYDGYISGNYLRLDCKFNFLDEFYTEKGMAKKSFQFIHEILFHPLIKDGKFQEDKVELVRKRLIEMKEVERENHGAYAFNQLLNIISPNTPISYSHNGYLEDYKKITSEELVQFYNELLNSAELSIYVCGKENNTFVEELSSIFPIRTLKKKKKLPLEITHSKFRKTPKTVVEKDDNNQSILIMGCKTDTFTMYEKQYVAYVYNYILGGGTNSYLFQNVREKNSLCYGINSSFQTICNLFFISAGIDAKNFKKCTSLIKKQMKRISDGDISEEMIENAKTIYIEAKKELNDSVNGMIKNVSGHVELGYDLADVQQEEIKKVTKEDIVSLSKKIHLDAIYLLEGGE